MTQSIKAQTANVNGAALASFHGKTRQTDSSFDLIMESSQRTKQDTSGSGISPAESSKRNDVGQRTKLPVKSVDKLNPSVTGPETKADTLTETDRYTAKETEDSAKDAAKDPHLLNRIMELLNSIWQSVMDVLNLSPEELQQLMEEQGMKETDLLDPDFLRQLVLANSGQSEISAALTDESLADSMKQLLQTAEELCAASGLDVTDRQVKEILAQLENSDFMETKASDAAILDAEAKALAEQELRLSEEGITENATLGKIREESKENGAKVPAESGSETDKKDKASVGEATESKAAAELELSQAEEGSSQSLADRKEEQRGTAPADRFTDFVDRMVDATQRNLPADFNEEMAQLTELREIANQIIEQIRVVVRQDQTSMELQLNPENLGKVNLSIRAKEGVMTAQFVVQNELTKEAIESQIYTLKDTLEQQGVKVETIEVTVAHYEFEQSTQADSQSNKPKQQKSSGGKKITLEEAMQMGESLPEEAETADITGMRGSQIDFTA
jgi:flagellar hook-length control protein FliK